MLAESSDRFLLCAFSLNSFEHYINNMSDAGVGEIVVIQSLLSLVLPIALVSEGSELNAERRILLFH